jgi:hypothetical protein
MIAERTDGANLLSGSSEEIASLITDANPGIQKVAIAMMGFVINDSLTDKRPYLSALQTAIRSEQTAQDVSEQMVLPLLVYNRSEPRSLQSVLTFMQRDDLTLSTKLDLVDHLSVVDGLPIEVNQALVKELDDPDPRVRAAAVVAFADSTDGFHALAKYRVARMADDPQEIPQVREKAKDAIEGKTHLDPNIDWSPTARKGH